jgi:phosphotriesterase-related protein
MTGSGVVQTYRGPRQPTDLGTTLIHEHIFVRNPELELSISFPEWNEAAMVDRAVDTLVALHALGIRTVVDLTVPGLGRDVRLVGRVAERVPVNLIAATGWYGATGLPAYFEFNGPDRLVEGPDPLIELFVRDIEVGIGGTDVRAGMIKVMSGPAGITPDVERVMTAAAVAHEQTGVAITTHSHPASRNGLQQQAFLGAHGVALDQLIVGHSGDSEDLGYLRQLMDNGSTIGMDRFGMEHILDDGRRLQTVLALLDEGYADRIVLSHDAAIYSHVTPPSWRARADPNWHMENLPNHVLPRLRQAGVSQDELDQMLVRNPRRLLEPRPNRVAQRAQEEIR